MENELELAADWDESDLTSFYFREFLVVCKHFFKEIKEQYQINYIICLN